MTTSTLLFILLAALSQSDALRTATVIAQRRASVQLTAAEAPLPRWRASLPGCLSRGKNDALDGQILGVALPSIANLAVIPIVGAVDTMWIGRMGNALALAGQGAANQCFFSSFFLIAFIPTITAPLVAKAAGGGDMDAASKRVAEALFLANFLGIIGTLLLVLRPSLFLSVVLPAGAPAAEYATRYLRLRSLSLVPALTSSIGFAAFRGLLDNVTPLKVSLASNLINLVLDPLLIFGARMGVAGAALATAISEIFAGACHLALLVRRGLLRPVQLLQPPRLDAIVPLIAGGAAMLMRQCALNVAFVAATRMTQAMDTTGVSAAAYAITNQVYSLGLVVMLAIQATGATLVPAALAGGGNGGGGSSDAPDGVAAARGVADRLIGWSTLIATGLAVGMTIAMPLLTPIFTPLEEVRRAVVRPALVSSLVMLTNGPLFAGEGIMMGVGAFGPLALLTSIGVAVMVAGLTISAKLGLGVSSVWASLLAFHVVQLSGAMFYHLKLGPLSTYRKDHPPPAASDIECIELPQPLGEVCVIDSDAAATCAMGVTAACKFMEANPAVSFADKRAFLLSKGVSEFVIAQAACTAPDTTLVL